MMRVSRGEGWVMLNLFTYIPPLFFFNTSHTQRLTCRLNSHANVTAMLNRTTQRLPHSHALNSAFLISSHLCPLPVSLLVFARLQTSMQNIACRVLCIHGLRCLSAVLHPVHKFWLRLLNLK